MSFEDFQGQDGHLGYRNRMILAILNLHVSPMLPTKFWFNLTGFESRRGFKIFKMAAQEAILDNERCDFSNSESLYCSDASHQVSTQSDLWFGRRYLLKNFKLAALATILDIETERF